MSTLINKKQVGFDFELLPAVFSLMRIKSDNKEREITWEDFDRLLRFFDPNPERAAMVYEKMRGKMIALFSRRGALSPEDLADEALNRLTRRLRNKLSGRIDSPEAYLTAVANNLYLEYKSERDKVFSLEDGCFAEEHFSEQSSSPDPTEGIIEALEKALSELSEADRHLILNYYRGNARDKKAAREALAKEYGLSVNALRIKAHRVREKLKLNLDKHLTSKE